MESEEAIYRNAFKEVYILINDLSEELYCLISPNFIKEIKSNMNKNYNISLQELEENGAMPETKAIMSLVYRDYLCDEEEKSKLLNEDKVATEEQREKYFDMFDKDENVNTEIETEVIQATTELMEIENENIFKKIINKIIAFFKR